MSDQKKLAFRLDGGLKERWIAVLGQHRLSQQSAVEGLIEWFCGQDAALRVAIMDRSDDGSMRDLLASALRKMADQLEEEPELLDEVNRPPDAPPRPSDRPRKPPRQAATG